MTRLLSQRGAIWLLGLAGAAGLARFGSAAERPDIRRDLKVIAACVGKNANGGQCFSVCHQVPDEIAGTTSCLSTPYIDALNEAIGKRWSCFHPGKGGKSDEYEAGIAISPVTWINTGTASVTFGIPGGLSGPTYCTVTRGAFGRWKARLGIRD